MKRRSRFLASAAAFEKGRHRAKRGGRFPARDHGVDIVQTDAAQIQIEGGLARGGRPRQPR
jgi:hypothetical protein